MKRILILLLPLVLYCFAISCTKTPDFSETVVITEDPDPNDPDPTDPDPNDPDPNDPDPTDPDPDPTMFPLICIDNNAGFYSCDNYDLMGWMNTFSFGAMGGNDCWGWTDPDTGKEYAIYGLDNGTAFIDISEPSSPLYVAKLPASGNPSTWRDIKVYNNHAYIVSEAAGHGMQVYDMTQLKNITSFPEIVNETSIYNEFSNAHNIAINEESGFAYAVGTDTYNGGPHFIDLQNPSSPVAAGGYSGGGYSHDAQIVNYIGPDSDYAGREIYVGSNETDVVIVDVTDKANPTFVNDITYSDTAYTHQGWFTEDHRYFIVGDELDELEFGFDSKTIIFDLTDLDDPKLHFEFIGATQAIDHNGYVLGDKYYLANYTAGLRVFDISGIDGGSMEEVGYFDVHPGGNNTGFDGAWSVYPYFSSGNIIISDTESGLFIVKAQ